MEYTVVARSGVSVSTPNPSEKRTTASLVGGHRNKPETIDTGRGLRRGVDERVLDEVVRQLNEMQRGAAFDLALRMGKLIVDRFYGGSLAAWRAHATREVSVRKLARRCGQDLAVTATSLFRAIALYELSDRLGVSTWKHLSVSHLRTVLGLPEEEQRRLLAEADAQAWTTSRLEAEASKIRRALRGLRGRRPLPVFVKTINRLGGVLSAREEVLASVESMATIDRQEAIRLSSTLQAVQELVSGLQQRLAAKIRPT